MSPDEQAIREVIAAWLRASSAGDVDAVLRLMTDDVVFLGPGRAPMRGKAEFAQGMREWVGKMQVEGRHEVREIAVSGDLASCWIDLEVRMNAPGAAPQVRRGPVLSVYRREADGAWRIARDANMLTLAS
jgi:uncharacterized protein (TIGR02246 family)